MSSPEIRRELQTINWRRAPVFFLLMLVVTPAMVFFVDAPLLGRAPAPATASMVIHGLLFALAVASLASWLFWIRPGRWGDTGPVEVWTGFVGSAGLVLTAGVTVVELSLGGSSTLLLSNLVTSAALALFSVRWMVSVYGLPLAVYLVGALVFAQDNPRLYTELLNGVLFWFVALVVAQMQYRHQVDLLTKNHRLDELALTDTLTGLANRRMFQTRLEWEQARAARASERLGLILVDLDEFKGLNDHHGHAFGDQVLKAVANALTVGVRLVDVVARWGGEEFLVLLPQATDAEVAAVAHRLRRSIEALVLELEDRCLEVTASFGAAIFEPSDTQAFHLAFERADQALYRAKARGRNRVEVG